MLATQIQLDAVINHLIDVQVLHQNFIANDTPALARRRAAEPGWYADQSQPGPIQNNNYAGA